MTEHNRLLARGWLLALLAAAFVTAHLVLLHVLRQTFLPGALLPVLLLLAVAKHLGLVATLLRRFYSVFRRRDGSPNPRRSVCQRE